MTRSEASHDERLTALEDQYDELKKQNDDLKKIIGSNEEGKETGMVKDLREIKKILTKASGGVWVLIALGGFITFILTIYQFLQGIIKPGSH